MNGCTVISRPDPTFDKYGNQIAGSSERLRFHFNVFDKSVTKFDITCYRNKPQKIETISLGDLDNENIIHVDLNEWAARLHISKQKIQSCTLTELWEKKANKFKNLNAIIEDYRSASLLYDEGEDKGFDPQFFRSKDVHNAFSIRKRTLMKIISSLHNHNPSQKFMINLSDKFIQKNYASKFRTISVHITNERKYFLLNESSKTLLLEGSHGVVSKIQNILYGTWSVIKESKMGDEISYFSLQREAANLRLLKTLNLTLNIQEPPLFSMDCSESRRFYYVGHYYNGGDLYTRIEMTVTSIARLHLFNPLFTKLIHALYFFHEANCIHHDIKTENIFLEEDIKGNLEPYISDVADMRSIHIFHKDKPLSIGCHTPALSPYYPKGTKLFLKEAKAFDVYQLGASIINAITGTPPYLQEPLSVTYPDFTLPFPDKQLLEVCSKQAVALLKKMCSPLFKLRITIKKVKYIVDKPGFRWVK